MSDRRLHPTDAPAETPSMLRPVLFSTHALDPRDQFDAYAARCAGVVDVEPVEDPRAGFAFENRLWKLGGIGLSCVETAPVRYARTPALVRRDPVDAWTVALFRHGGGAHSVGSRDMALAPGRLQIGSMAAPFAGHRGASAWQMLFIARDSFPELADRFDGAEGAVPEGPLAGLLTDFLLGLEAHLARAREADRPALVDALRAMLVACLAPSADRLAQAAAPMAAVQAARARAMIQARLGQPQLGPRLLGRELGLSRSCLYRLFEAEGGVARYIQRQRLLAARAALADPACVAPVGQVAERFGFVDQSVFSRAYRAEFGITPRDTRLAGSRERQAPTLAAAAAGSGATLGALLRAI